MVFSSGEENRFSGEMKARKRERRARTGAQRVPTNGWRWPHQDVNRKKWEAHQ